MTPEERTELSAKVIKLRADGHRVKDIAETLGLSRATVTLLSNMDRYEEVLQRTRSHQSALRKARKNRDVLPVSVATIERRREYEARLAEIPEDRRSKTARVFGDPVFERSALFEKLKEKHTIPIRRVA